MNRMFDGKQMPRGNFWNGPARGKSLGYAGALAAVLFWVAGCSAAPGAAAPWTNGLNPYRGKGDYKWAYRTHFISHGVNLGPKGIDSTGGPFVTSLIFGRVTDAYANAKGYTIVTVQDDLGFKMMTSCFRKIFASPNEKVSPLTVLGMEGSRCPYGPKWGPGINHVHSTLYAPQFEADFGKDDYHPVWDRNGLQNLVINHEKLGPDGSPLAYLKDFRKAETHYKNLVTEATRRLNDLGQKYRDTHMGSYLSGTKDMRPYERALVLWRMWQREPERRRKWGLTMLADSELRDIEKYLTWHASLRPQAFAPYPNPDLKDKYVKSKTSRTTHTEIAKLWRKTVITAWRKKDWPGAHEAVLIFLKKAGLRGRPNTLNALGAIKMYLGRAEEADRNFKQAKQYYRKAKNLLLTAEALYVDRFNTPARRGWFRYWTNQRLARVYHHMAGLEDKSPADMHPLASVAYSFGSISSKYIKFRSAYQKYYREVDRNYRVNGSN